MLYEIRLIPLHEMPVHDVLQVTITGATRLEDGVISLADARERVAKGEAVWIGDAPPEEGSSSP